MIGHAGGYHGVLSGGPLGWTWGVVHSGGTWVERGNVATIGEALTRLGAKLAR